MATSEPRLPSPPEAASQQRTDRRANASPAPAQSKRDKKRQLLTERLATLSEKFNRDRDLTYREQLQKIQIDTNLVMRVEPYVERPLDFIAQQRMQVGNAEADHDARSGGRSLLEMAGPTFQQWVQEIGDLVEERDFELTKQKVSREDASHDRRPDWVTNTSTSASTRRRS